MGAKRLAAWIVTLAVPLALDMARLGVAAMDGLVG